MGFESKTRLTLKIRSEVPEKTNSVDHDQTAPEEQSDQDLHCCNSANNLLR